MNKSTKLIGIAVIILLVIGVLFFSTLNKHTESTKVIKDVTTSVIVTPVPTTTIVPPKPTSTSKYTAQFRALARSSFISNCKLKEGQQYASACECGADYLAAHYTDAQLEKAYIEYHSGNKIPTEVRTAYDACKNK